MVGSGSTVHPPLHDLSLTIRHVYNYNLAAAFADIVRLVDSFPIIGVWLNHPGILLSPIGTFHSATDYRYQCLRANVDLLRPVELVITLADEGGRLPEGISTWIFEFTFNGTIDMASPDVLDTLRSDGLDIRRLERDGIDLEDFGEALTTSGLVLETNARWVVFQGAYTFGFLLKLLTAEPLPAEEHDFFAKLRTWFPCLYDVKYLLRCVRDARSDLADVADAMGIRRTAYHHRIGTDALLLLAVFFELRTRYFDNKIDDARFTGALAGLSTKGSIAARLAARRTKEAAAGSSPTDLLSSQPSSAASSPAGSKVMSRIGTSPGKRGSGKGSPSARRRRGSVPFSLAT